MILFHYFLPILLIPKLHSRFLRLAFCQFITNKPSLHSIISCCLILYPMKNWRACRLDQSLDLLWPKLSSIHMKQSHLLTSRMKSYNLMSVFLFWLITFPCNNFQPLCQTFPTTLKIFAKVRFRSLLIFFYNLSKIIMMITYIQFQVTKVGYIMKRELAY